MEAGAKAAIDNAVIARNPEYVIRGLENVLERVSLVIKQHFTVIHGVALDILE
ncbi:hypothetical protein DPMN_004938 [Dreissena polymorpha]|uniref:Uncharacterized protein n=1 Tax=Dreissena polymorpha TaxID=45954 RepID=A0A9D4MPE6_DREPO|nr:hypothetical protein DPMN_004938 [Dreissena polymorpha]